MHVKSCAGFFIAIATAGCEDLERSLAKKVGERISVAYQAENLKLQQRLEDAERKIRSLEFSDDLNTHYIKSIHDQPAILSVEDKKYAVARNEHGAFMLSVENVEPALDGYKVKLLVGNPTNATYDGAEVVVEWGLAYDAAKYDEVKASRKKKEFSVLDRIRAGYYTPLEVMITPAKPEELKYFSVRIKFNQLHLAIEKK